MICLLQPIMFHKRQNSLSLRRQNRQDCQSFSGPWAGWFGKE